MAKITREKFIEKTGNEPKHDDLARCNCHSVGRPGHYMCGWCPECDKPRFLCGHSLIKANSSKAAGENDAKREDDI
jgi:hypothetical protein